MKRVIVINNAYGTNDKYVLSAEHDGFGTYEEQTPSGATIHQSWLVSNNNGTEVVIKSFNHMCEEEVLDIIDFYNEMGIFGIKAKRCNGVLYMHRAGTLI